MKLGTLVAIFTQFPTVTDRRTDGRRYERRDRWTQVSPSRTWVDLSVYFTAVDAYNVVSFCSHVIVNMESTSLLVVVGLEFDYWRWLRCVSMSETCWFHQCTICRLLLRTTVRFYHLFCIATAKVYKFV